MWCYFQAYFPKPNLLEVLKKRSIASSRGLVEERLSWCRQRAWCSHFFSVFSTKIQTRLNSSYRPLLCALRECGSKKFSLLIDTDLAKTLLNNSAKIVKKLTFSRKQVKFCENREKLRRNCFFLMKWSIKRWVSGAYVSCGCNCNRTAGYFYINFQLLNSFFRILRMIRFRVICLRVRSIVGFGTQS